MPNSFTNPDEEDCAIAGWLQRATVNTTARTPIRRCARFNVMVYSPVEWFERQARVRKNDSSVPVSTRCTTEIVAKCTVNVEVVDHVSGLQNTCVVF